MKRILMSWVAFADFKEKGSNELSEQSPNLDFHKENKKKYDMHILLIEAENDVDDKEWRRAMNLKSTLEKTHRNISFKAEPVSIKSAFDLPSIYRGVENILKKYSKDEVDIIFTIGSTMMSLVWYMLHSEKGINTHLIQGIAPFWLPEGKKQFSPVIIERKDVGIIGLEYPDKVIPTEHKITKSIDKIYQKARIIAKHDPVTTLITGESGSGKEDLAKTIHQYSKRNNNRFVVVNCSSLSDQLLESRLFGSVKGSFTGSTKDTIGFFQEADKGTIFLDEIGDVTPYMQQSLLRVLQEGTIIRVGDTKEVKVDVRVISATNKDLLEEVKNKRFREDLYYRLNETEVHILSLRERGYDEIKELVSHFIEIIGNLFHKKLKFPAKVLDILAGYSYPGNVRQLQAVIKNIFIFNENTVDIKMVEELIKFKKLDTSLLLEDVKKEHINKSYQHFNYRKEKTAKALGITINTLKKYLNY